MTSLLSWLTSAPLDPTPSTSSSDASVSGIHDLADNDAEGSDSTVTDSPPAFPALNSAQRAPASSSTSVPSSAFKLPRVVTDEQLMPPPPLPAHAQRVPGVLAAASSTARTSSSSLALPLTTTAVPKKKFREKVALAPGFGPLDWAELKSSGVNLRGTEGLMRVTPTMLKMHKKRDDAWTAIYGRVYNITPYLPYHPGGEKELMRVAGRDGTKLFASTHAWVNHEFMLDKCLVGFLVADPN